MRAVHTPPAPFTASEFAPGRLERRAGQLGLVLENPGGEPLERHMAEALDKIKTSLLRGYAAKSGKSDDEIAALMAAETWVDAKTALELIGRIHTVPEVDGAARYYEAGGIPFPAASGELVIGFDQNVDASGALAGEITSDGLFQFGLPEFFQHLKSVSFSMEAGNGPVEVVGVDNVRLTTAVPEPETWALMLASLGLLGLRGLQGLRRKA